ncbi:MULTISPECIES: MetQ/NlpA family ABC transporter substrate-binding protein [unclassified Pseudoclavibacter]|uniref:MetQ/NlpA family ABC transporter substrate-binding protein n=1 Tax=unclassified Pseudoclavibacter TaxID=2615177 RepID=UPI0013012247|nr:MULTISPECIES: MetQ/NlpA family ABC transporter substrate-binding protein [unclassified Pseudoclavibacter]KAB1657159.1 MetQ/NlpA family ABC transporter substrate-binding protein [Pseudoclavibacter sp. CFCC 11306]KAB1659973.1 MetQ/NlpA family ABC transporter substrate-binding protein [Pseudoclavibacter sp. CFCC 13796]
MNRLTKRLLAAGAIVAAAVSMTACSSGSGSSNDGSSLGTIKVGALPTPAGDILKFVADGQAKDAGLDLQYVEFSDYNTPNPALADGSVDANLFQHQAFLDNSNKSNGTDLVSVGTIYLPAAGFYSKKVDSLDALENGSTVAIPNDPTNEGRALELLAANKVIEIPEGATSASEISSNPRELKFEELDNPTLARAVDDSNIDAAFVTSTFALGAGLTADQAIILETTEKYANVLATRPELKDDARVQKLHELLTSDETKKHISDTWQGQVLPLS